MPETPETASEIQEIRFRLEAIEATQNMLVRREAPELLKAFLQLFQETPDLKSVYLAVNGQDTQAQILERLHAAGVTMSQPTLSRRMDVLKDNGLIERVPSSKSGDVYEKNKLVERMLRLSRTVEKLK